MKKEEVLARSKNHPINEYEEKILSDSQRIGIFTILITCIFFGATKVINGGKHFYEFPAILFAYFASINYYNFSKLKNKYYLISAFCSTFAFICFTILYFITL